MSKKTGLKYGGKLTTDERNVFTSVVVVLFRALSSTVFFSLTFSHEDSWLFKFC